MEQANRNTSRETLFQFMVLNRQKIQRPFEDRFKDTISPMQLNALALLKTYGAMSMTELAEKMNITKQQMTQIIGKLHSLEYVERFFSKDDRRVIKIACTQKAEQFLEDSVAIYFDDILDEMDKLSAKDYRELQSAIRTMVRILPDLENCGKNGNGHINGRK